MHYAYLCNMRVNANLGPAGKPNIRSYLISSVFGMCASVLALRGPETLFPLDEHFIVKYCC